MDITAAQRKSIAERVGVDDQYLYQCLTRRRQMEAAEAVRVERESFGRIRRWDLRWSDWHRIWPELAGSKGAPTIDEGA